MLDIRLIRAEPEQVKARLATVGVAASQVDELLEADRRRREAIQAVEALRAERTAASKAIRDQKDPAAREAAIAAQRGVGERIAAAETAASEAESAFDRLMLWIPNLPHPDVPVGADESANVVVRTEGELPSYDFAPLPHWDLGPRLGIIDFERGVKISGTRFYVLRGMGARLQRAIITWMLDLHTTRARLRRGLPARHGARRLSRRHREPAQVRRRPLPGRRGRVLVVAHGRGAGDESLPRRDPDRGGAPATPRRLHAVLPAREDVRRT